jgi:excisionase family DNA binding protein
LYAGGQTGIATICRTLGISRATLYRALKERRLPRLRSGER